MVPLSIVKLRMEPVAGAATVEALKANIEPARFVLLRKSARPRGRWHDAGSVLTMESKHCVQSSL